MTTHQIKRWSVQVIDFPFPTSASLTTTQCSTQEFCLDLSLPMTMHHSKIKICYTRLTLLCPLDIVCLLLACLTSQQQARVCQGRICSILHAATLRQKLQIKLSISSSHSILTTGWPVPVLTLQRQASGWVATGVPIFQSLVWLDSEKSCHKDSNLDLPLSRWMP